MYYGRKAGLAKLIRVLGQLVNLLYSPCKGGYTGLDRPGRGQLRLAGPGANIRSPDSGGYFVCTTRTTRTTRSTRSSETDSKVSPLRPACFDLRCWASTSAGILPGITPFNGGPGPPGNPAA